jgi:hypothetical protein
LSVSEHNGRPRTVPDSWTRRLRELHEAGLGDKRIARDLNRAGVPTAHSGAQWWPTTVRRLRLRRLPEDAEQNGR